MSAILSEMISAARSPGRPCIIGYYFSLLPLDLRRLGPASRTLPHPRRNLFIRCTGIIKKFRKLNYHRTDAMENISRSDILQFTKI
jgi:hypothetical protein